MRRAVIYARYSSEKQSERSCRDQIDLCRAWAGRQGDILVVADYSDEAVSGASTINRLGLARLMRDAREGAFDIVICEALDRLSRDQADLATIRKQLTFLEIGISTVADGEVGAIHVGLKGLMGELFLADLAAKTRRGQSARVRAGASGGGQSYGYDPVPGSPGEMTINEDEAAIVRRIFGEYAAGRTPREIAAALNRDGIRGPRSAQWNASTINGSRQRANGILRNRLYVGEIVWNRQRFVKDPATGRRISRLNPESDWIISEAPHLAIISRGLWNAAQSRQAGFSGHAYSARRPKHLLSGLLRCACCGGGVTIINRDRLGCSAVREKGTCDNRRTIARRDVEARVTDGLIRLFDDPGAVAAYVQEYHRERNRLAAEARSSMGEKRARLENLRRSIDRGLGAMLDGSAPTGLGPRIRAMEIEADGLEREIAAGDPGSAAIYPEAAGEYAMAVREWMEDGREPDRIRQMIESVGIAPDDAGNVRIDVTGYMPPLDGRGKVVAGTRNSQWPTFRIAV